MIRDESSRACGGKCCESFYLGVNPEEMGRLYVDAAARIIASEDVPNDWELVKIGEMVIRVDEDDESSPRYSCRNLLPSGLCGIYDTRPVMCRDYPGYGRGGRCEACGFTPPIPIERRLRRSPEI